MKQAPSDKYNVAWFKLAEFISRGEKERALGLYRLLIHSFDDYAFGCQLAGDILFAFNDPSAVAKYKEAALLYKKSNRLVEAAGLYEQLLLCEKDEPEYFYDLMELYTALGYVKKYELTLERLALVLMKRMNYGPFMMLIDKIVQYPFEHVQKHLLFEQLFIIASTVQYPSEEIINILYKHLIHEFKEKPKETIIATSQKIKAVRENYYERFVKDLNFQ